MKFFAAHKDAARASCDAHDLAAGVSMRIHMKCRQGQSVKSSDRYVGIFSFINAVHRDSFLQVRCLFRFHKLTTEK